MLDISIIYSYPTCIGIISIIYSCSTFGTSWVFALVQVMTPSSTISGLTVKDVSPNKKLWWKSHQVGHNYYSHWKEKALQPPQWPLVFWICCRFTWSIFSPPSLIIQVVIVNTTVQRNWESDLPEVFAI